MQNVSVNLIFSSVGKKENLNKQKIIVRNGGVISDKISVSSDTAPQKITLKIPANVDTEIDNDQSDINFDKGGFDGTLRTPSIVVDGHDLTSDSEHTDNLITSPENSPMPKKKPMIKSHAIDGNFLMVEPNFESELSDTGGDEKSPDICDGKTDDECEPGKKKKNRRFLRTKSSSMSLNRKRSKSASSSVTQSTDDNLRIHRFNSMPSQNLYVNSSDNTRKTSWTPLRHAVGAISGITSPRTLKKHFDFPTRKGNSYTECEFGYLKLIHPVQYSKFKIIQVQEKFPHEKLDLDLPIDELEKSQYCRQRNQSPLTSRHNRQISNENVKSPDDISIGSDSSPISPTVVQSPATPTLAGQNIRRVYITEGLVKLSSATSTNERYLFLFNDLLLVAKVKSASTYKLKERVRVSEIWISHCIEEVAEATIASEKSFVIGWPTVNHVATFSSTEEKDHWLNALEKAILERRDLEQRQELQIRISNRIQSEEAVIPSQTMMIPISSKDDVRSVIKMAVDKFQCQTEDVNDLRLWCSTKTALSTYPLIGHELPYSIKKYYSRQYRYESHDENDNEYDKTNCNDDDRFCSFTLKKSKKTGGARMHLDLNNQQKKWKKNPMKKSPIINWAMNKKVQKPIFSPNEPQPPGRLFGNPLSQLATEEDLVPKPIQDILTQLFRKGPNTTGIFRKSALQRTVKQVRQMLDTGKDVDMSEKSAVVLATVLKDFFRSLPDSLISSELYDDLIGTRTITENQQRIDSVKRILERLQKEHYAVTMKFLCALHHIQRFSSRNNMNAYNLSICVSPSVMWPPSSAKHPVGEQTSGSSDVICFLIDNYVEIFSQENEYILGNDSDIEIDDGPGEDSDSGNDQVIYRCQCPQYSPNLSKHDVDDESDFRNDSEKEADPSTPVLSPHEINIHSAFAHSDSSIDTNESDEKLSLKFNTPTATLKPEALGLSKSSPSSPTSSRRDLYDSPVVINEPDVTEQYKRKLLKQSRNKRVLSSTTASAELIEHKRVLPDFECKTNTDNSKRQNNASSEVSDTLINKSSRSNSDLDGLPVVKKQVISQPIIQHFATEYYATPKVVFHTVDRRRQPAAPSYEEHIQKTKRMRPGGAPKAASSSNTDEKKWRNNSFESNKDVLNDSKISGTNSKSSPNSDSSRTKLGSFSKGEVLELKLDSKKITEKTPKQYESPYDISRMETSIMKVEEVPTPQVPIKVKRIPMGQKPIIKTAKKAEFSFSRKCSVTEPIKTPSSSTVSPPWSPASSISEYSDDAFATTSPSNISSSINTSAAMNSPFALNLKSDPNDKKALNKETTDNKSQSIQLEKTLLTKAPKKIDQLTMQTNENTFAMSTKTLTARDLKRTNKRLKHEVRNAFKEGQFVCGNNNNNNNSNGELKKQGRFDLTNINLKHENGLNATMNGFTNNRDFKGQTHWSTSNRNNNRREQKENIKSGTWTNSTSRQNKYSDILTQEESYV